MNLENIGESGTPFTGNLSEKRKPSNLNVNLFSLNNNASISKIKQTIDLAAQESNSYIEFDTFESIQRSLEALTYLDQKKVSFSCLDFPLLKKGKPLKLLVEYLRFTERNRGNKIKKALQKRSDEGKKLGLGSVSKAKRKKILSGVTIARRTQIIKDPDQIKLREKIRSLHEDEGLGLSPIAKKLNELGFKTSSGSKFQYTTVSRLYKLVKELREYRKKNIELEKVSFTNPLTPPPIRLKNFKKYKKIKEVMEFTIVSEISNPIKLVIFNNKGEEVHQEEIAEERKNISIPIEKLNKFLPGLHYLRLELENTNLEQITCPFYYYEEALPPAIKTEIKEYSYKKVPVASFLNDPSALKNEMRANIRNRIIFFREQEGMNFDKITAELNKLNYKTFEGSDFQKENVLKEYKLGEKLRNNGIENPTREAELLLASRLGTSSSKKMDVENFKRYENFRETMEFKIKTNIKEPVNLTILNNLGQEVHKEEIPKKRKNVKVNLEKLNTLLPGLFYLLLESKKFKFNSPFYYHQEVIPPLNDEQ